ncbi:undecaprenyl/decaprenyl-phosphate alpha-N-acetylglucosaminyl 1-phosphate transferase, partial [Patescibacteria group bacterium]|nr:undecaprenyl/decaprenyl-phosphate alpha-N-acetylglucosaminyl 1-phosphate transferase [Patescibacteria group bacterium]
MINYIYPAVFSFLATIILLMFALKFFPKWKMMDRPENYDLKRAPIPYYGGLVIFAVVIITLLIFIPIDKRLLGVLIGGAMIAGISFLDDLKNINPFIRLSVQILAALTIVVSGIGIDSITNPLGGVIELNQFAIEIPFGFTTVEFMIFADIFTIIWIVMVVNTMNFLDGLNGLVSGVTFIAALTMFILSIGNHNLIDQSTVATLAIVVAMTCLAFWFFDFYPAKILMGDTGTMFLGFLLAVMAIFSGGKIATAFLVLGFPILDAFWVIIRRILSKKSPMKGDLKHLHHRLLEVGLSDRKALIIIYLLCAIFGLSAIFLGSTQKLFMIIAMG